MRLPLSDCLERVRPERGAVDELASPHCPLLTRRPAGMLRLHGVDSIHSGKQRLTGPYKTMTMPKRSKDRKPPADLIAKQDDFPADAGKNRAAQWLGRRGGQARAKNLSSHRKSEI